MDDDQTLEPVYVGTAAVRPDRRRGRGALSNASGRFEREQRVAVDDGWDENEPPPPLRTTVTAEQPRTIINRINSPDIGFDRTINPYRGCEHGCVYCFARPTHAYYGLSPGLDFETRLFVKPAAARLLRTELADRKYICRPIALGTNTDPYQPLERERKITRQVLEILSETSHPFTIVTKNALVVRDLDLIAPMAARGMARVALSVTTLDRRLARTMEPRASTPPLRLDAIRQLAGAGVPVTVMVAPLIPALNEEELEAVLQAAHDAGARHAAYVLLRLPLEIAQLWQEWLKEHYPDRAGKVMAQLRAMRGGKDYDAAWGMRQTGTGDHADLIRKRFDLARRKLGLDQPPPALDCSRFTPPREAGGQFSLF